MCPGRVEAHADTMFSSYDITRALVADHQSALRQEARQLRWGRFARRARSARVDPTPRPSPAPVAIPARPAPSTPGLPPAAALAAWQHDKRAA